MALITLRDISLGFGLPLLLERLNFQVEKGERVCLVGRNGAGKSSLLKLMAGEIQPDDGDIWRQQGLSIATLVQDVPTGFSGTIFDVVAGGLGKKGIMLSEFNRVDRKHATLTGIQAERMERPHRLMETKDGWEILRQVEDVLFRNHLNPEDSFETLSAGMKRRVLFARSLVLKPDLLLLDEPTNHLDIDTIIWLETFILRHVKTLLFITHDRTFLSKIATRIVELDRGRLFSYDCDYETYIKRRQGFLNAEEKQTREFDKKLSREEDWIRSGIKARRSRNEGRVRALKKMRQEKSARRKRYKNVKLKIQEAERTGKIVIKAKNIKFSNEGRTIFQNISTVVMRGDKVGIVGPNGIGKTTLLKVLLKKIQPDSGSVHHGTHFRVAYFDQLRTQLDEMKTVQENIGEGNDFIVFNDNRRHVISYLQDFLFTPERSRTPVHVLSGGERNRLLLGKLFAIPANIYVLDEPTNDLDTETLELLEELLFEYKGTLLLVSHDRTFLNNVVTSLFVFEEKGQVVEYAGGYDDWLIQRPQLKDTADKANKIHNKKRRMVGTNKSKTLGYMGKRELSALPERIDALEKDQKRLYDIMSDPMFYKKEKEQITKIKVRLDRVERQIEKAYRRWEELESISENREENMPVNTKSIKKKGV